MERPADINFVSSSRTPDLHSHLALPIQTTIAGIGRHARLNVALPRHPVRESAKRDKNMKPVKTGPEALILPFGCFNLS
jgi:hypothetical protein